MAVEPNPYSPPVHQEDAPPPVPSGGPSTFVDVPIGGRLPDVCLKCGSREDIGARLQTFVWSPGASAKNAMLWGALFGAAGAAIANARVQRTATLEIPLCHQCNVKWQNGPYWVGGALGFLLFGLLVLSVSKPGLYGIFGFLAVFLVLTFLAVNYRNKHILGAVFIDDEKVRLSGVSPIAVERLEAIARAPAETPRKKKKRKAPEPDPGAS
jgi:hypothetical protein